MSLLFACLLPFSLISNNKICGSRENEGIALRILSQSSEIIQKMALRTTNEPFMSMAFIAISLFNLRHPHKNGRSTMLFVKFSPTMER